MLIRIKKMQFLVGICLILQIILSSLFLPFHFIAMFLSIIIIIWQRRFWEHTIRDENDLYKHLDYIHYNSVKHYGIAPRDWNCSSFNKFVKMGYYEKDWCNLEDKYKINEMDCE